MAATLADIKGIGAARRKALESAGIFTPRDLVMRLPADYRDLTKITPLSALRPGEPAAVRVAGSGENNS